MKHKISFILAITGLAIAICSFGASTDKVYTPDPWFDAHGGPDAYGYTWVDSDEIGGPPVEWIDITGTGTLITGLGDDNYVGPFNLGFNFNYYWYTVNQLYVGSNGYIKFPPPYNIASPFPASIPLTANPNDYIAIYCTDLWFTGNAQAYYWSNGTNQFIVSFLNVPAWQPSGPTGSHTFQVILNGTDNTIHLNYGTQSGTFYNNDDIIGVENNNGQVGLERLHDAYIPHNNYSIVYYRPDTTSYAVHDYALTKVINENSTAIFLEAGDTYNPVVWVKNVGNQIEAAGATVNCQIKTFSGSTVYNQTVTLGSLNPGVEQQITYTTAWTAATTGQYSITGVVTLSGDMNANNNTKVGELEVVSLPGELLYDDGTYNSNTSWNGGTGGIAQRFVPPTYPVQMTQAKFYIYSVSTTPTFYARIYDDDGVNGSPSTMLFGTTVTVTTGNQWYTVNVGIPIESGAIYVSWEMTGENTTTIGIDTNAPISRNTWENTGVWAPYRSGETDEGMIRAVVSPMVTNDVEVTLTPYGTPIVIPPGGGNFSFNIALTNNETAPVTMQAWTKITLPSGSQVGPLIGPVTVTLGAGASANRDRSQTVPGSAPAGNYTYDAYVGTYPGVIWDEDHFPFSKSAVGDKSGMVSGWFSWGEEFGDLSGLNAGFASPEYTLRGAYPNPFNPSTSINFSLSSGTIVTLTVYDVAGRAVAKLVDGWMDEGEHSITFNADNLPSGIYFCRLSGSGFSVSEKMVLMK